MFLFIYKPFSLRLPRLHRCGICNLLAEIREKELKKGNKNRATLAIARKLVAYMMAVDENSVDFIAKEEQKVGEQRASYSLLIITIFPPVLAVWGLCIRSW